MTARSFLSLTVVAFLSFSVATAQEPVLLKDINDGPPNYSWEVGPFTRVGAMVYFPARDTAHGMELWKTDGTTVGTVLAADVVPGPDGSRPSNLTDVAGVCYFEVRASVDGTAIWRSDGTPEGTTLVRALGPTVQRVRWLRALGTRLVYAIDIFDTTAYPRSQSELWVVDGESQVRLATWPWATDPFGPRTSVAEVDGKLVFGVAEYSGDADFEPWVTDGTPTGTLKLRVGPDGNRGVPVGFTAFKGKVYFQATDGQYPPAHGAELWMTDGTRAGTRLVSDTRPGSDPGGAGDLVVTQDYLYFTAQPDSTGRALYRTDGVPVDEGGTTELVLDPSTTPREHLTAGAGGIFFHTSEWPEGGAQLWWTDGHPGGRLDMIEDIAASPAWGEIASLTSAGDRLYFVGDDGISGRELWTSDGTPEGTDLVADLFPGPSESYPTALRVARGRLYFVATDGETGYEPWVLDVRTPAERIAALIVDVEALNGNPLNLGQAKSLLGKLELALVMLEVGNTQKATVMLTAFVHEVGAFERGGVLTAEVGDPLIAEAERILEQLL